MNKYCDCPKTPGKIYYVNNFQDLIHDACGKRLQHYETMPNFDAENKISTLTQSLAEEREKADSNAKLVKDFADRAEFKLDEIKKHWQSVYDRDTKELQSKLTAAESQNLEFRKALEYAIDYGVPEGLASMFINALTPSSPSPLQLAIDNVMKEFYNFTPYFRSANDIPNERAVIHNKDWKPLAEAIAALRPFA